MITHRLAAPVLTCVLAGCSRSPPAPVALPEPTAPASAPVSAPPPGGAAPSASTVASSAAPALELPVDPASVTVPPLDAETRAALAAFVTAQKAIAGEVGVERKGPDSDLQISPRARGGLTALKRASREAARRVIGAGLAAGAKTGKVLAIQLRKALDEAGASMDIRHGEQVGEPQLVGRVVGVGVERPAGHPTRIAVGIELSVPCGDDGSLYVLEQQPRGAPSVLLADEANGYASIGEAHSELAYRLSLPDAQGGWFAVVSSASPWCESSWRGMQTRVVVPGPSPEAPRRLLAEHGSVFLGERELFTLTTGRDDFSVTHVSGARFGADLLRQHVHHYVRRAGGFERAQPLVERALDLPGEWSSLPWALARRFVAGSDPEALRLWHARLERKDVEKGDLIVESTDEAAGRTRLALTCQSCKVLPPRLLIDVQKDGDGWAMAAITEVR